ncbi:MAG: DUF2459 domain-containing protein [Bacteroidales bacterium]|nr:DUF2459 domain-containing protein [Bacteroidales bacterium]MDD4671419.1 DUF2459 domain-containing protein [Bacteroidales bacterium]MDY0347546.1 DUF2459 domain-containing protein [Tenuifilaceae bacterium]
MKIVRKIVKWILYFLLIPVLYILISLILTVITIDRKADGKVSDKSIYLSTNGVHLYIVLPKKDLDSLLLSGIKHNATDNFLSFGWGDENFYMNTPAWGDLTFNNAFRALFLKSTTLIHITRHKQKYSDWVEIKLNEHELQKLNAYLLNTFETDKNGTKAIPKIKGYSSTDDFYKANGSYSCFKTCNSWVNTGFKESGLKSCLWTPFDFGLLYKYK